MRYHRQFTRRAVSIVAACLVLGLTAARPAAAADALAEVAQSALEQTRGSNGLVGLAAAVSVKGEIIWAGGSGFADIENQLPARPEMVHRIGSISKPLAAVAAMQLVEAGKVDLDAALQKQLPQFPTKPWPIAVRHLLSHTSGIRHYRPGEAGTMQHYRWMDDAMAVFQDDELKFEPGTAYGYTTYGYTVLGAIVEAASKEPFGDYMRQHVWEPAGMKATRLEVRGEIVPNRARGYSRRGDGTFVNARYTDLSIKYPGGGMLSTVGDLLRFASAFNDAKLVSADTRDTMLTPIEINGESTGYGFGFRVGEHNELGPAFLHGGAQAGTTTYLIFFREPQIGVAVISNRDRSGGRQELAIKLATIAGGQPVAAGSE